MISSVPTGIAFSSFMKHTIGWYDLESESLKASTKGLLLKKGVMSSNHFPILMILAITPFAKAWTHVREIPGSNSIISLIQDSNQAANFEILDISKGNFKKVFTFEEVYECKGYL